MENSTVNTIQILASRTHVLSADAEPLVLTLARQDVRAWLQASYTADGQQTPSALELARWTSQPWRRKKRQLRAAWAEST